MLVWRVRTRYWRKLEEFTVSSPIYREVTARNVQQSLRRQVKDYSTLYSKREGEGVNPQRRRPFSSACSQIYFVHTNLYILIKMPQVQITRVQKATGYNQS